MTPLFSSEETNNPIKQKIASYCAYQERCQQEVRHKLYSYDLPSNQVEVLIAWLITEDFIDEERFSKQYAGGKFRVKQWGKIKIVQALKKKNISEYCIKKGLKEIDEVDYLNTMQTLIEKKTHALKAKSLSALQAQYKVAQHLISRGFESERVWDIIKSTN